MGPQTLPVSRVHLRRGPRAAGAPFLHRSARVLHAVPALRQRCAVGCQVRSLETIPAVLGIRPGHPGQAVALDPEPLPTQPLAMSLGFSLTIFSFILSAISTLLYCPPSQIAPRADD